MVRTPSLAALASSLLLASSALVPAAAQQVQAARLVAPPTFAGTYDLASNSLVPPGPGDSGTSSTLFDNTADSGSYYLPGSGVYDMDWGTLAVGGNGASITALQIAYATTSTAGPISLTVRLHQGATGNGFKGTEVLNLPLTGLPASTNGQAQGYVVDLTLVNALALPDGPIGWSYEMNDALTGPLLVGPPNAPGVIDSLDRYVAANDSYVGTFTFTGATPPFASLHLQLTGRANNPQIDPWINYGAANGMTLTASGPATPGSTDNQIHITGGKGKKAILVAGLVQSAVTGGANHITFYALPWLVLIPDLPLSTLTGSFSIQVGIPLVLSPGMKVYLQTFGQSLTNTYNKFSDGLELTVQ